MKHKQYSQEEKDQLIKEAKETGNITLVAQRHNIPKSTLNHWVAAEKPHNIEKHKSISELKDLKNKLADAQLENKVLKELLKKTYQVWNKE